MPLWHEGVKLAARRMPARIGPKTHAVLDYAVAGSFFLIAARLWRRHRRAAIGSLFCGGVAAANAMLTDYPGGVFDIIDYKTHARIDAAVAAIAGAAPRMLGFAHEDEAKLFGLGALAQTVSTSLTDFDQDDHLPEYR